MKQEAAIQKKAPAPPPAKYDPALASGWGGMEGVDPSDILVPKMLIMQPISELVASGKVPAGSLIRSTTGEILGGKKGQDDVMVPFIPLLTYKDWTLKEEVNGKYEFRGREPFTAENADAPWDYTQNGKAWKRDKNINLFVLLPADIDRNITARKRMKETGELPSPDDSLLPMLIQFTRTSFKVGRGVVTHFAQSADMGIPAACSQLSIYTEFVKGDKGSYFVYKLGVRATTDVEHLIQAKKWYGTLSKAQGKIKVDDRDETSVHDVTPGTEYAGEF